LATFRSMRGAHRLFSSLSRKTKSTAPSCGRLQQSVLLLASANVLPAAPRTNAPDYLPVLLTRQLQAGAVARIALTIHLHVGMNADLASDFPGHYVMGAQRSTMVASRRLGPWCIRDTPRQSNSAAASVSDDG
jgi:hypothetical protein